VRSIAKIKVRDALRHKYADPELESMEFNDMDQLAYRADQASTQQSSRPVLTHLNRVQPSLASHDVHSSIDHLALRKDPSTISGEGSCPWVLAEVEGDSDTPGLNLEQGGDGTLGQGGTVCSV
jgi:hypothetical protein